MAQEADRTGSALMARCLTLTAMAALYKENRIAREFYLIAYTSLTAPNMIRENDSRPLRNCCRCASNSTLKEELI